MLVRSMPLQQAQGGNWAQEKQIPLFVLDVLQAAKQNEFQDLKLAGNNLIKLENQTRLKYWAENIWISIIVFTLLNNSAGGFWESFLLLESLNSLTSIREKIIKDQKQEKHATEKRNSLQQNYLRDSGPPVTISEHTNISFTREYLYADLAFSHNYHVGSLLQMNMT